MVNDEIAAIQKYISELVASATGTESTVEESMSDSMSCDFDHDIEDSISELETVKHELNDFKIRCDKHANENLKQYVENLGTDGQTKYVEETLKQCYYISNNNYIVKFLIKLYTYIIQIIFANLNYNIII